MKWVAIITIKTIDIGIVIEASTKLEAKYLVQALIARRYPGIEVAPVPFIALLTFDETGAMNPSER